MPKPENVVAVDPGKRGAIAVRSDGGVQVLHFQKTTPREVAEFVLLAARCGPTRFITERLRPMPFVPKKGGDENENLNRVGRGAISAFHVGCSFGRTLGQADIVQLVAPYPMTVEEVTARTWQRYFGVPPRLPYADRKRACKALAENLYPKIRVTLANADALLIAEYGWKTRTSL